jgi:hypothetical protein
MITAALVIAALLGLVLIAFGLPGSWLLLLAGALLGALGGPGAPGGIAILVALGLALVGELVEWIAAVRWTGRRGGSRRAGWGALAGGLIGALIGLPIPLIGSVVGSFLGSFAGALFAEYSVTRNSGLAGRVAWGALVGRVVGTAVKMSLTVVMAGVLIVG